MRIARVRLQGFRGYFDETILVPPGHVVVVGEPRSGRTDLITALRRVLDPRSTLSRPNQLDIHRQRDEGLGSEDDCSQAEVEVTILDLGPVLAQNLDDRLELIDPATGLPAGPEQIAAAEMGVRLRYHLQYDPATGLGEHWVDYPASGQRAPRVEREALRLIVLDRSPPLQLRAEGLFRQLALETDEPGFLRAIDQLAEDVDDATVTLSGSDPVRQTVDQILARGIAELLEMPSVDRGALIGFMAEDGSLAALLRAIQPSLSLDLAGPLPLSSHGSTTCGILSVAEVALAADAPNAVVIADDFGDDLDVAAAEYLAARLRRDCGQIWLSTRRHEVVRAFRPEEVLRLTRSHGSRRHHRLSPTTDKKTRVTRRQLHVLLLPAMTARAVALLEGIHDLDGYTAVADRRLRESGALPPSASGIRMIAAGVSDGGKSQFPQLARLAAELGFHVRVVLDNDKPGADADLVGELQAIAEQIIQLPIRSSVERALVRGLPAASQRDGLVHINAEYGLGIDVPSVADDELESVIIDALKKKGGLHRPFVEALPAQVAPPIAVAVLDTLVKRPTPETMVEIPLP